MIQQVVKTAQDVGWLISILCFFGHSHSSIDNSYELFICCTCYDNLSVKKMSYTDCKKKELTLRYRVGIKRRKFYYV